MSDLNSSASCVGSLEDACSVAMMYAYMGGIWGRWQNWDLFVGGIIVCW